MSKLIASIIFEGETLSSALSSTKENENHLIDLLTTVQERIEVKCELMSRGEEGWNAIKKCEKSIKN